MAIYEKAWYENYAQYLANLKFNAWMGESKARKDEELKKDASALQAKVDEIWKKY